MGGGGEGGGGENPVAVIHRLLRGRYLLALVLALAGAVIGAGLGWMRGSVLFTSEGKIYIKPDIDPLLARTPEMQPVQRFNSFIEMQVKRLRSPQVMQRAADADTWLQTGKPGGIEGFKLLRRWSSVGTDVRVPELILVQYQDKDARTAQAAVESIIKAYETEYSREGMINDQEKIAGLEQLKAESQRRMTALQGQINEVVKDYGTTDLKTRLELAERRLLQVQEELDRTTIELARRGNAPSAGKQDARASTDRSPQEIAAIDDRMQLFLTQQQQLQADVDRLLQRAGEKHPDVVEKRKELTLLDARISSYAKMWNERPAASPTGAGAPQFTESTEQLRARAESLEQLRQKYRDEAVNLGNVALHVEPMVQNLARERETYAQVATRLDQLMIESRGQAGLKGRVQVEAYGDLPDEPKDSRKKWAAVGFVMGGGMPIALLLLFGLMDRRFRYSDETGGERSGTPLLGILPHLPRNLADPEQAAAAAHCVHRIRSLLQLAPGQGRELKTIAMTSSIAGDGKTSLTLSLGLSYAASGSRTLLIDFDLIGLGLTTSLSVKAERGIGQAIVGGEALPLIVPTKTENLSLLPASRADEKYASRLSGIAVRRILNEVSPKYDVVLIDTGPILGSLEAAFVGSCVEGVVLVVGRGQQKSHVDRAVQQLRAVGANLVGIVFNRASAVDFRKSIASASIRSVGVHPPSGGDAHGHRSDDEIRRLSPVAQTVVIDVEEADEEPAPDSRHGNSGPARGAVDESARRTGESPAA